MVEYCVRDAGVAGSNPVTPTSLASSTYVLAHAARSQFSAATRAAHRLCDVSSVIRTITIAALFHPARHWRRRHARRLGSDSLGRSRRRNRGRELVALRIFENAIEIADLHRMLLHHGRQGSGELIDFPRSDTT